MVYGALSGVAIVDFHTGFATFFLKGAEVFAGVLLGVQGVAQSVAYSNGWALSTVCLGVCATLGFSPQFLYLCALL